MLGEGNYEQDIKVKELLTGKELSVPFVLYSLDSKLELKKQNPMEVLAVAFLAPRPYEAARYQAWIYCEEEHIYYPVQIS